MKEKMMVSDTLAGINASLAAYGTMIPQTENAQLRQTLQQMRNCTEQSQYELYRMAKDRQYYIPAKMAMDNEVSEMKQTLSSATGSYKL